MQESLRVRVGIYDWRVLLRPRNRGMLPHLLRCCVSAGLDGHMITALTEERRKLAWAFSHHLFSSNTKTCGSFLPRLFRMGTDGTVVINVPRNRSLAHQRLFVPARDYPGVL